MVSCGCFSSGSTATKHPHPSEYEKQESFPQPPATYQSDDTKDIYTRISEAMSPVEAERTTATVNAKSKNASDFDGDEGHTGSSHALLAHPSGGFTRTSSIRMEQSQLPDLRRSVSDRGVTPGVVSTPSTVWTESRKELEVAIHAEKAKDHADWNPDLQSEEQRLKKRLGKLNLEMKVMVGDGNCQFRAVSYGLYGSQDYHRNVRQKAVEYMRAHKEDYDAFLGENIDEYLDSMDQAGTWGDELTLRAISDHWGIVINVVTSDQHNWFMRYKPPKIRILLEIFLTYIAPVHYNAIRRQTITSALRSTLSRSSSSSIDLAMKRAYSAERALGSTRLAPNIKEAIKQGYRLDAPTRNADTPAAAAPVQGPPEGPLGFPDFHHQRKPTADVHMDSVAESLNEGRSSVHSLAGGTPSPTKASVFGNLSEGHPAATEEFRNPLADMQMPIPVSGFAAEAWNTSKQPLVQGANGNLPNGHLYNVSLI